MYKKYVFSRRNNIKKEGRNQRVNRLINCNTGLAMKCSIRQSKDVQNNKPYWAPEIYED